MALRLLLDENLRSKALLGAWETHQQTSAYPIDLVRVGDAGGPACHTSDEQLLTWAANSGRIVVTLDAATLPECQARLHASGLESPGVILLRAGLKATELIELFALIAHASEPDEWRNMTRWIP
ncbi:MAG: DUF5615 family PIN-like protein [Actinomycetota bacterium]|nr:DUF5615 family PIN-like protein [Actinomycetota bacterium]